MTRTSGKGVNKGTEKTSPAAGPPGLGFPVIPSSGPPLIFLIGYRGTGKSTVARLLAQALRWQSLDVDEVIEAHSGRRIRQIFAEEGEAGFRRLEAEIFRSVCQSRHHVIATGGGVVLCEENRRLLRESGWTVRLTADAATLWQRTQVDPATLDRRPNLTVGGLAEIEELLRLREPFYRECASCTVDTANRTPEEVTAAILAQWKPS
jgi:shikimate kinase